MGRLSRRVRVLRRHHARVPHGAAVRAQGQAAAGGVEQALGFIPSAAFAALVANDLLTPGMFDAGLWPAAAPLLAAGVVAIVAWRTKSLLWCAVSGVAAYALLSLV